MMRKKFVLSALLLLVSVLLCISGGVLQASGSFDWQQCEGQKLNLIFNKHPWTDAVRPLLPEFEARTGIKLSYDIYSEEEYMEKLMIDLATGAGNYDVAMTGVIFQWQYSFAGWIQPLEKFLNDPTLTSPDYRFEDFYPGLVASHSWSGQLGSPAGGGHLWGIPIQWEVHILAYNRDLLDKAGVAVPQTLMEEFAALPKLTGEFDGKKTYGLCAMLERSWATLDNSFWPPYASWGCTDFNRDMKCVIDSPRSVEFCTKWVEAIHEYGPPVTLAMSWYEQLEAFCSGDYAFYSFPDSIRAIITDPEKSNVVDNLGYALVPQGPSYQRKSHVWSWGLSMNKETKVPRPAWLFIQWSTLEDILVKAALLGNVDPPRQSVWLNPQVVEATQEYGGRDVIQQTMEKYAQIRFTPNPVAPAMGDRFVQALQEIYHGEDAQKALSQAARDIDQILKETVSR